MTLVGARVSKATRINPHLTAKRRGSGSTTTIDKRKIMNNVSSVAHLKKAFTPVNSGGETPNYLAVGLGYFEHSVAPFTEKWLQWSNTQRVIAIALLLPLAFFPLVFTLSFLLPAVLFAGAVLYVFMFGWETSRRHAQEAVNERFGKEVKKAGESLEDLRARALQLKEKAGNYGADGLYYAVDGASVAGHHLLAGLMYVLDNVIELLVSLSRNLNVQKKKLEEQRASMRTSPAKRNTSAKPVVVIDNN